MEKKYNLDNWENWSDDDFNSFRRYLIATFAGYWKVPLNIVEDPNNKFTNEDINQFKKSCKIRYFYDKHPKEFRKLTTNQILKKYEKENKK